MYRVAILGCENSHANNFLTFVLKDKLVNDVEVVGVYSEYEEAGRELHDKFGVYVADSYDEFVGKVDGIIITARHGDNHYKYAKPYIASGIPMFIDKPITCTEEDAKAFVDELKAHQVPVCGGSMCVLPDLIQDLKKLVENEEKGKVVGGYMRAPMNLDNEWGGFYFYTQHLVQMTTEIFGCYPESVQAFQNGNCINCTVRYKDYDVNLLFVDSNGVYYAGVSAAEAFVGGTCLATGEDYTQGFQREFMEFYELLTRRKQKYSYRDFFAPVYILNAIDRSLKSGKEEAVHRYEV